MSCAENLTEAPAISRGVDTLMHVANVVPENTQPYRARNRLRPPAPIRHINCRGGNSYYDPRLSYYV